MEEEENTEQDQHELSENDEEVEEAVALPENVDNLLETEENTNADAEPEAQEIDVTTQAGQEELDNESENIDEIEDALLRDFPKTPPPSIDDGGDETDKTYDEDGNSSHREIQFELHETIIRKKFYGSTVQLPSSPAYNKRIECLERTVAVKEVNIIDKETKKAHATCVPFSGVIPFAADFVDNVIDTSRRKAFKALHKVDVEDLSKYYLTYTMQPEDASVASFEHYNIFTTTFPRWPRIKDFTKNGGLTAIDDFLSNWEFQEDWLYCIDFLLAQSDECCEYYLYEAKWSIPTKPYPIPQATASVYFTIEVSRVKPSHCLVDVTYTFESSRIVHSATRVTFDESWLFNIIDSKLSLYQRITF